MVKKRQFLPAGGPYRENGPEPPGSRRRLLQPGCNLTTFLQMERVMDYQKGWWQRIFLILGILAVFLAGVGGCAGSYLCWESSPSLTDPKIQAGPPESFIQPDYNAYRRYLVAVLPFRVPAVVNDVGYPITEVFHRQLLEKKPFRGAVRVAEYYNTLSEAQRLAKAHGAELFIVGEVPYFLDSGTTGQSGLQVDLRIVETSSGRTIMYLSDTISASPRPIYDLWVTESKPKPSPSIYFLVETLASRMCLAMEKAMEPPDQEANSKNNRANLK